ncbi:MAG: oligosaccharide flippase family protein [Frankiales bacterium]|nr:oligosaccharide flippase family protein [Frankiales bacterium]
MAEAEPGTTDPDARARGGGLPLARWLRLGERSHLMRNSFYLMATTAVSAAAGFVFWVEAARLYSPTEVGEASALLSAVSLFTYFSLLGFNSTLIRFLPSSADPGRLVGTALVVVALAGALIAVVGGLVLPRAAPDLRHVLDTSWRAPLFVLLTAGASVNLLTDSVFVARRRTEYNLLVDGVLMGVVRVALPVLLVAVGAFGIFLSHTLAATVAAVASIWLIQRRLGIRIHRGLSRDLIRETYRYSGGTYLAGALNLVPQLVLPLVVLRAFGPVDAALYFVAFQIANLINAIGFAVGQSTFAEGSHDSAHLRQLALTSARAIASLMVPAILVVSLVSGPVLSLFGPTYADSGRPLLIVLSVSALGVAFNSWSGVLLKITAQLGWLTAANAAFCVVALGLALMADEHELLWVACAWGLANVVGGLVGLLGVLAGRRARAA